MVTCLAVWIMDNFKYMCICMVTCLAWIVDNFKHIYIYIYIYGDLSCCMDHG